MAKISDTQLAALRKRWYQAVERGYEVARPEHYASLLEDELECADRRNGIGASYLLDLANQVTNKRAGRVVKAAAGSVDRKPAKPAPAPVSQPKPVPQPEPEKTEEPPVTIVPASEPVNPLAKTEVAAKPNAAPAPKAQSKGGKKGQ
jgi:hypothetical protein